MAKKKKKKEYGVEGTLKGYAKRLFPMSDHPSIHKKVQRTKKVIKKVQEGKGSGTYEAKRKKCRSHQVLKGGKCVPKKIRVR